MDTNFALKIINPWHLAAAETSLKGTIAFTHMPRLLLSLEQQVGQVKFSLKFTKEATKLVLIYGKMRSSLPLACQRCMQPMSYSIDTEFILSPVLTDEEAIKLSVEYDPLMTDGHTVRVVEIIEQELLLCLPLVARHAQCKAKPMTAEVETRVKNIYPFVNLAKLKKLKIEE